MLSLGTSRTRRLLAYLAERGWLVRVHHGLYAQTSIEAAEPSEWRHDPWIVAAKILGPTYYFGGWSACEHWDLTEQVFRTSVVFTTRRVRSTDTEIHGFPIRIRRTALDKMFGLRSVWREQSKLNLSDPARTVIDILDSPELGGGIRHVADVVSTYFDGDHRNDALLANYLQQIGNRSIHKRLGYLIEALDVCAPELRRACVEDMSAGVSLLDPSLPNRGSVDRRWNLRVNAKGLSTNTDR